MTITIHCLTCGKPVRFLMPFGGPLPEREWYCGEHGRESAVVVTTVEIPNHTRKDDINERD